MWINGRFARSERYEIHVFFFLACWTREFICINILLFPLSTCFFLIYNKVWLINVLLINCIALRELRYFSFLVSENLLLFTWVLREGALWIRNSGLEKEREISQDWVIGFLVLLHHTHGGSLREFLPSRSHFLFLLSLSLSRSCDPSLLRLPLPHTAIFVQGSKVNSRWPHLSTEATGTRILPAISNLSAVSTENVHKIIRRYSKSMQQRKFSDSCNKKKNWNWNLQF